MKRLLCLLLAFAMVLSLAGCGSKAEETPAASTEEAAKTEEKEAASETSKETESTEPKTFTMFAANQSVDMLYNENPGFLWACDNVNVYFDITQCAVADLDEKKNLLLASGDYPDVFYKSNLGDGYEYGSQGIFIPLEDLIREHAPNLCALLDEQDGWKYITASDGHVYTLPELQGFGLRDVYFFINKQWIENVGMEMPTDLDSLYEVLKAFKEKDANGNGDPNDEVPLASNAGVNLFYLLQYFDYNLGSGNEKYFAINENDELFFIADREEWKEYLLYLKKLYDEELVNQDCFTVTLDESKARGSSSTDVIYGCLWDWAPQDYLNNGWAEGNTLNEQYAILPPFKEGTLATSSGYKQGTMAITDKCSDPAAVMQWVDQYYSEEGAIVGKNGVEGISWEWLEDGTWDSIKDEEGKSLINSYNKVQGAANHPGLYPTEFQLKNANVSWITGEHAEIVKVAAEPWPSLQYTAEEKETLSVVQTDIKEYVWEYLSNVVIGEMDLESTWDTYLDTLKAMKLDELKAIVQDAYTRATAK